MVELLKCLSALPTDTELVDLVANEALDGEVDFVSEESGRELLASFPELSSEAVATVLRLVFHPELQM